MKKNVKEVHNSASFYLTISKTPSKFSAIHCLQWFNKNTVNKIITKIWQETRIQKDD